MTSAAPESSAAEKLVELLDTLPVDARREITAWLLDRTPAGRTHAWLSTPDVRASPMIASLGTALPAGEDSQLVTIRLPADRHAALRAWCAEHNFTMAAVVRGLVERFLEEHTGKGVS